MTNGKLALVRFPATETSPETILAEVRLDDTEVTIVGDLQGHRITPEIRELAQKLIDLIISEVEQNGGN